MRKYSSCFNIITCGSDSKDGDEIAVLENKDPRDKRGWSFRKRSSQHRVLNNTVTTETTGEKEHLETVANDFQLSANSTVPEKTTLLHFIKEEAQAPNIEIPIGSDKMIVTSENESKVDAQVDESIIIIIQAGIRGALARRVLVKIKHVVKVQAVVRGLLVRRRAVGTLRCVQAIIKMQTLVRARRALRSREGLAPEELHQKHEKDHDSSKITVKGELTKSNFRYTSTDKLLTNRFAVQLLESVPRNKPINIKCDPSKHDSAWKWLERWMAVSSLDNLETKQAEPVPEHLESENNESHAEDGKDQKNSDETEDLSSTTESISHSESKDLITHDANNLQYQVNHSPSLSVRDDLELFSLENSSSVEAKETSTEVTYVQEHRMQSDAGSETEVNSPSEKHDMDIEQVDPLKQLAPEQTETEDKKFVLKSKKVSNPSFITAQAKFEQLSSAPDTSGTMSSMHQDTGSEPHSETVSSTEDSVRQKKSSAAAETVPESIEFSISSSLDTLDRSEAEGFSDVQINDATKEGVQDPCSDLNLEVEVKTVSTIQKQNDYELVSQPELVCAGHSIPSEVTIDDSAPSEAKPERCLELKGELDTHMGHQAYTSSPEASPRSRLTVPESQGTPSSQVSVNANGKRSDKIGSYQKLKSLSAGKKSPSSLNRNSGTRSSVEPSQKDQKTEKRRNSFDSARPDHIEPELLDSGSNTLLPHYMQATESARAKLLSSNSPRSSPDVQDRETYIKKRHSLPADGRQVSPRIQQQPISRVQQGAKGNEKMWRR